MSYKITRAVFSQYVQMGSYAQVQSAARADGYELSHDLTTGFLLVSRPEWPVTFHIPPMLIAALESEHVAPVPIEDTVVARRPRKPGTKEAA